MTWLFLSRIVLALAILGGALLFAIVNVRKRKDGDEGEGLPPETIDRVAVTVEADGPAVAMQIWRVDGRQSRYLIDPRHAHQLSDGLLMAAARAMPRKGANAS